MGVTGCGKSTIGKLWARRIGAHFLEGDEFHGAGNIDKMSRGQALDDDDRWPWLNRFSAALSACEGPAVGACSALKRRYRERITETAGEPVQFIHLDGSRETICARMQARQNHFMPAALLDSQFADLQRPGSDERAVTIDVSGETDDIIARIEQQLGRQHLD